MYEFIQKFHSGWAYIALAFLLLAVINSLIGFSGKKEFIPRDRKIAMFALIFAHIQLLVGLIVYFVSPLGKEALSQLKNPDLRLTALEHPLINIIAIVFITIGWSMHKKKVTGNDKFKALAVFYSIGLALILIRIPWHLWF